MYNFIRREFNVLVVPLYIERVLQILQSRKRESKYSQLDDRLECTERYDNNQKLNF